MHFYVLNNERSERGIKEAITFSITSKRIKYLGINLLKQVKDLYENYMMLIKEMEDNSRWKDIFVNNKHTTQDSLQIQCNHYQIINGIFHRTRTKKF